MMAHHKFLYEEMPVDRHNIAAAETQQNHPSCPAVGEG